MVQRSPAVNCWPAAIGIKILAVEIETIHLNFDYQISRRPAAQFH